ncbi:MAG: N-acetylmuramidase domain-containing protein [Janthinobacterium lividum]
MDTHRFGDQGDDIGLLQRRLEKAGCQVAASHIYDAATEAAVMQLQQKYGLVVDGIAGPKTLNALAAGRRHPKHLTDADLAWAADVLNVPLAAIRAVNEVESRGCGFLPDGRPVILFERHIFWRQLKHHGVDPQPIAQALPDIVSQRPGKYLGGAAEYMRLASAEHFHAGAAYESASWGAFQIMGCHWSALGYSSVDHFVACMENSESDQLEAFVRFVTADAALLAAMRSRRWTQVAKLYNGPNYARHLYDVKLARAYLRYADADRVAA